MLPNLAPTPDNLTALRAQFDDVTRSRLVEGDETVRVTDHSVPGPDGAPDVHIRLYRPVDLPAGAPILYQIHGGGMLYGTAEIGDPRHRDWSKRLGCAIASVDYRLAPETPYPGALLDCYAGLEWVHANAASLGLDPDRIAVRGESAGGLLAAALTLYVRDHGGPKIALSMLIYPMLDDRVGAVHQPGELFGQYVWTPDANAFAWTSWLGMPAGAEDTPYHAAPARAPDLSSLPPTFIAVGQLDLFLEEDLDYALRLIRAGVPTELHVTPGAFHGFDSMAPESAAAMAVNGLAVEALRRAFAR